jgi:hypothetical protein
LIDICGAEEFISITLVIASGSATVEEGCDEAEPWLLLRHIDWLAAYKSSAALTVFRGFQPSMYLVLGLGLTPVARARKHVLLGFSES